MRKEIQDFKLSNSVLSRLLVVRPDQAPKAVVQFVHGFGEHLGMFGEFGEFFAGAGVAFVMHDQQGHGQRAKKTHTQGQVSDYQLFLDDVTLVRSYISEHFPDAPVVLFGFSMGGNIGLNYLLKYPDAAYQKAIMQSPWLRLAHPQAKIIDRLAAIIGQLTPKPTINAGLDYTKIMHDSALVQALKADKIYHLRMGFRLYSQILERAEYALAHAGKIKVPLLLLQGGEDGIVSPAATAEFAAKAGDNVQLISYPHGYHALHIDTDAEDVRRRILAFIAD